MGNTDTRESTLQDLFQSQCVSDSVQMQSLETPVIPLMCIHLTHYSCYGSEQSKNPAPDQTDICHVKLVNLLFVCMHWTLASRTDKICNCVCTYMIDHYVKLSPQSMSFLPSPLPSQINKLHLCKPLIRAIDSSDIKDRFSLAQLVTYRQGQCMI